MGYKKKTPSKDFFQHPTEKNRFYIIEFLSYDSDWNWLMEVVDKIESLKNNKDIIHWSRNNCTVFDIKPSEANGFAARHANLVAF